MTTFADYASDTMASNDDFTLYPFNEVWTQSQPYAPTTTYADQTYSTTTFDSYDTQQAWAGQDFDQYSWNQAQSQIQLKDHLQAPSEAYSPTNSASHSFDLQPPVLSSTSDSGASVQSAMSSATGSPSMNVQQAQDWNHHQQMSMLPSIMQHHDSIVHNMFATTGHDVESIPATEKGCVGELMAFSSSTQQAQILAPQQFSNLDVFPFAQATDFNFTWPPQIDTWSLSLPGAWGSAASSFDQVAAPAGQRHMNSSSPTDTRFKSPTTPASASSPFQPLSPVLARVKGHPKQRRRSVAPAPKPKQYGASPLGKSMSYHESDVPPRPAAPPPAFPSPFFSQSSGIFVPPLESSYPSLIQPFSPAQYPGAQFPDALAAQSPQHMVFQQPPSPAPPKTAIRSPRTASRRPTGSASPYLHTQTWQPYPQFSAPRRQSISSVHSRHSQNSTSSDDSNKGLCPIPTCGRHFKDLKAHMLTHQNERPEKCPIPTCEYHTKGFARKYDKNRHTLTHYKGTMVCGFCPGSGSAAEKSFNRADVFKRHLTSVHGVEQTPPNARRKSPTQGSSKRYGVHEASGMCSTCGVTFINAQEFYEHLDDCVLRVVQQAEPSEAINEQILTSISNDEQVKETMDRHMLPNGLDYNGPTSFGEEEDEDDEEDAAAHEDASDGTYGSRSARSGKGALKSRKAGSSS